jgi:hypothetical protein
MPEKTRLPDDPPHKDRGGELMRKFFVYSDYSAPKEWPRVPGQTRSYPLTLSPRRVRLALAVSAALVSNSGPRLVAKTPFDDPPSDANDSHPSNFDPITTDFVISEFLVPQIAQSGDHLVAEWTGREGLVWLDQRHGEPWIQAFQGPSACRASEAPANDDNSPGHSLR